MIGTVVGIVLSVAATFIVSRYYFQRSIKKSLTPYLILNTRVFGGIDPDVRGDLRFMFRGEDVKDVQHLQILVANDGERAISDVIEPLRFILPEGHRVLDASVLHKNPESLQVAVDIQSANGAESVAFCFPLLNKGEYFVVKLLLSGFVPSRKLSFTMLADDLPRTVRPAWLPSDAMRERSARVEWPHIVIGSVILIIAAALGHSLYILRELRPALLPVPWAGFQPGAGTFSVVIAIVIAVVLFGIGLAAVVTGFAGLVPKRAKFPLPFDVRRRFGYFMLESHVALVDWQQVVGETSEGDERPA